MRNLLRMLALLLLLTLLAGCNATALAEDDDEEIYFSDVISMDMITYNNVPWEFPVDIMDMEPELIRLANKQTLLPKDFVPQNLVDVPKLRLNDAGENTSGGVRYVDGPWQLSRECLQALVALCDAARAEGYELYLKSGYRSYRTQSYMYENRLEKYGYDDGWVARPGSSDHQTGLGCDVVPKKWTDRGMNEDMAREPETQWMAANCARFGFILRYPADKEDVTQINYEPWHLRYVGVPVATYIMENGLTLEEFHEELAAAIEAFVAAGGPVSMVDDLMMD
ncbi:MAG: M15 family metallopeptidase [Clostridia bacterium]|nr:M15 family metallopeptidase [Clostridia bacterium]